MKITVALLTAAFLAFGTLGTRASDNAEDGAAAVQSLLKKNPTLSAEEATVQALKELAKKKAARAGAAEEGLAAVWQREPGNLKAAALKIMAADPLVAGYVVRTAGRLNHALNQELMVAALKTNPEFLSFAVKAACDNEPSNYRALALAADATLPGHAKDVIDGVMASDCDVNRGICWHYRELEKRQTLDVAGVLDEAVKWQTDADKISPRSTVASTVAATAKP